MVKVTRSRFKVKYKNKMVFPLNPNGWLDETYMIDINEKMIKTQGQVQRSRFKQDQGQAPIQGQTIEMRLYIYFE